MEAKHRILDALWRDKMHIEPQALDMSLQLCDSHGQMRSPFQRLRPYLVSLPTGLLGFWHASPRGHLVYTHRGSQYASGAQIWQERAFEGLCFLSVRDLVVAPEAALEALCAMLGHLLGSHGDPLGPEFADGAGVIPSLSGAAAIFLRIHDLGYGHEVLGATSAREYLARSWAVYLTDPRRLNVVDPRVFKLFHDILMNERFWAQG